MAGARAEADEVAFSPGSPRPGAATGQSEMAVGLFTAGRDPLEARRAEAEWLAGMVGQCLADGERSIGLLVPTRRHLPAYVEALGRAGIAPRIEGGGLIAHTPEGLHLINLARALANPADDLAWAGLLRSPWSWVPISVLTRVGLGHKENKGLGAWWRRLNAAAGGNPEIRRIRQAVNEGMKRMGRDKLAEVVELVWLDLDGAERVASLRGEQGVENCRRLLEFLGDCEQGFGPSTLARFEARVAEAFEPPDPAAADSPVSLMTIHQAKGLEFDVVLAPHMDRNQLARPWGDRPAYIVERLPGGTGRRLAALAPDRRLGESDRLYDVLSDLSGARRLGEAKRLFYVALTRARRRLFMSAVIKTKEGLLKPGKYSFLKWLCEHEGLDGLEVDGGEPLSRSGIRVEIDPVPPSIVFHEDRPRHIEIPEPLPVEPQVELYRVASPSKLAGENQKTEEDEIGAERFLDAAARPAVARGNVIHRIFETIAKGADPPGEPAIQAALLSEGLDRDQAERLAAEIAAEVDQCLADPFLSRMLRADVSLRVPEWEIEDKTDDASGPTVRSGAMDLVVMDGDRWWIVDYKTSRPEPGQTAPEFALAQGEKYAPQLSAYRRMLAEATGAQPSLIEAGIYLTATRTWQPVSDKVSSN